MSQSKAQDGIDHSKPASPTTHPPLTYRGLLRVDLPCLSCGYNLRGLKPQGSCPECGHAVVWSLRTDLLKRQPPEWVASLSRATAWITASIVMLILLIPAAIAYQLTIGPIYPDLERVAIVYNLAGAGRRLNAAGIAFLLMWQLVVAASLIGNWKLTRLEPNAAPAEQKSRSRRFAGYLIGSSIVANWLAFIIAFTPAREIAGVLFPLSFILFSIGWLLLLSYLSSLAERVPDHRLARSTARYKRFCLISVLVLVLGVPGVVICGGMAVLALAEIVEVILIAANLSTDASLLIAALVVAGVLALIPLVAVIWGIRLLILYRRSFKLAAQEAQYFWSLEPVDHEAGETETHASSST